MKTPVDRKLQLNYRRNQQQDHTQLLDQVASEFDYNSCREQYWNPEEFSLLYGTPVWEQASSSQRVILNQLYWVAYYSQIISAEIATIFFNQTSAAGLYAQEDFRLVCDMLDLESSQERSHIQAFKTVGEQVELALFGKRIFTYPMRSPFTETMLYANTNYLKNWWKKLQLHAFGLLSSDNTFLACQYFTVRGLRTLNGKLVQHKLSRFLDSFADPETAPIPSKISYYHFMDESFHFNSSTIISHDIINCIPKPTKFEQVVANLGIQGCQRDHANFSVVVNGIFWYDPALYNAVYEVLRSQHFNLDETEAKQLLISCFTQPSEGLTRSYQTHQEARESYQAYLDPLSYVWKSNKNMEIMQKTSPKPPFFS
ncbi:MAG: P-aminobenzoate N-oxygenase AurF [Kamptonema sp. SIO4C4]|nr:P-aminobenzoate N-oxygenase AurF [Kamptonema sp. SIO4C4]